MNNFRSSFLMACAVGALVLTALENSANAQSTTFAQFVDLGGSPFTFTNTGSGGTFSGSTEGYLTFLVAGAPQGQQLATITLNSTAVSSSQAFFGLLAQPIDGLTNTLTFTRVSDAANLLTVNFSGDLVGFNGDVSASLSSNTTSFTSQFLDFSGSGASSALLDVSAIDPGFTQNGNGFADSFTGDLAGGFSTGVAPIGVTFDAVPEPSTYALLLGGLGMLTYWRLRKNGAMS